MKGTNEASADVTRAIQELGLESKLVALSGDEARSTYEAIEHRFASSTRARWMWEHLRNPGVSREFGDNRGFERLAEIVPSRNEQLLYFPGSDEDVTAAFRGTIEAIAAVIGDCSCHEYIVAPLGLDWFVCENHHDVVIAVGASVESRLRMLSAATPGPEEPGTDG